MRQRSEVDVAKSTVEAKKLARCFVEARSGHQRSTSCKVELAKSFVETEKLVSCFVGAKNLAGCFAEARPGHQRSTCF